MWKNHWEGKLCEGICDHTHDCNLNEVGSKHECN
jgi:hypothetical protein